MAGSEIKCKGCGGAIEWVQTSSGQRMPVDPKRLTVVTDAGAVVTGRESHFSSCPKAFQAKEAAVKRDAAATRVQDVSLVILGLCSAELSEGQAVKATKLDRIEVRDLQHAMEALIHGLQTDGGHHKQHDIQTALRILLGVGGEAELQDWLGYEDGIPS